MQTEHGIIRQVIQQGGGVFEKQRQIPFYAAAGDALAHILVDAATRGIAFKNLAELQAKARNAIVIQRELACWQQAEVTDRIQATLAIDIKGADGLDFIVEQIQPVGQRAAHRE